MRKESMLAKGWWDFTTLEDELLHDVAALTVKDIEELSRPGFKVIMHDTLESFYLAEALDYIKAWERATPSSPAGICGPIGPTEQLPLVAKIVNELKISLKNCHFWGMDEWVIGDAEVSETHPLSFAKADRDLFLDKIDKKLSMPEENIHFPKVSKIEEFSKSFDDFECLVMQGGQGDTKHWAFNDPVKREGEYKDAPPSPEEFRQLSTRVVELHPITLMQNARTSAGGYVVGIPTKAVTVGPKETWNCEKVTIWQAGVHDNPFGMRLTPFMISKGIVDSSVPMSLLAEHPNVEFHYYRMGLGSVQTEMH